MALTALLVNGALNTTTGNGGHSGETSTSASTTSPPPVPAESCALPEYPTAACTGVPTGWKPRVTHEGNLLITTPGKVIEDYLVTGDIDVRAVDVVIRSTRVYGIIDNFTTNKVFGNLLMEDVEVVAKPGETSSTDYRSAIGTGNYTCRRCKVMYRNEGFRVGGASHPGGAGPVTVQDSYMLLTTPPGACETLDPHGDGIQGYDGAFVHVLHNTIDQSRDPCPTAPVFIPHAQGNHGGVVRDNVLAGGSFSLRLFSAHDPAVASPAFPEVTGNKLVNGTWGYNPVDVDCAEIGTWSGNAVVTFDFEAGSITSEVRPLEDCA